MVPVKTRIDVERRTVWFEASEPIVPDEVIAAIDEQVTAGAWSFRSVGDYSKVRWVPLPDDVRRLVRHVENLAAEHGARGLTAIVVGNDLARFGMARMYELMLKEQVAKITVFHNKEDALVWVERQE